jgi:squalene-associated FAD-dependent desaturase
MMQRLSQEPVKRVLVIGGGLAGIAASIRLARADIQVQLYESRRRLGGRVGSFTDTASGQQVDYCQHVAMQCCVEFRRLLVELDQLDSWQVERTLHFFSQSGKHLPVRALPLPAPLHLAGLLLGWPDLSWKQRLQVGRGLLSLMRLRPSAELHRMPAIEWLKKNGQDANVIKIFWETILVSALGEQLERVNLGATHKVLIDGFAARRDAYWLWIPKQPLARLFNEGTESQLQKLGVELRLQSAVSRLKWRDETVYGAELNDGSIVEADAIVLALPWYRAHAMLSSDEEAPDSVRRWACQLELIESSPITGVHTWWDKAWLHTPHAILVGRLCQWVFPGPETDKQNDAEHYYQIVISGSRSLQRGDSPAISLAVENDLKELFPAARDAKLLRSKIVTDPQAVFSVQTGFEELRPTVDKFAKQRLWICGDWTDTGWPATMEGAVRSGNLASESIINQRMDVAG